MNKKYTQGFKEQTVQKALSRGFKNLDQLAQELSVGYSTLQKLIREYKELKPENDIIKRALHKDTDRTISKLDGYSIDG